MCAVQQSLYKPTIAKPDEGHTTTHLTSAHPGIRQVIWRGRKIDCLFGGDKDRGGGNEHPIFPLPRSFVEGRGKKRPPD